MERRDEMTTSESFRGRTRNQAQQEQEQRRLEAEREAEERRKVAQDTHGQDEKASQDKAVQQSQQEGQGQDKKETTSILRDLEQHMMDLHTTAAELENSVELGDFLNVIAQARHRFDMLRGAELQRASEKLSQLQQQKEDEVKQDVLEDMKQVRQQSQEGKKV